MISEQIIDLYESGKSSYEVSKLTGVSPTQVRRILKKYSIQARDNKTSQEIEDGIIERYTNGESSEKIGTDLNLHPTTICRIIKRRGLKLRTLSEAHKILNQNYLDKNYCSINIVSYNGQKLTSKALSMMSIEEREEIAKFLLRYFRQNGFPYEKFDNIEMKKDFNRLCSLETHIDSDIISNLPECGLKIFKPFFHHFYEVKSSKLCSMVDSFNNDDLLLDVIRNRLGITLEECFNITGNMIRQGIRNSRKGFAASSFRPSLAKTIYDKFAPNNSIVLDISVGFGQRMLGAMACKNVKKYIGLDPWDKQINSTMNVQNFLGINEEKVELYQTGSEVFCPDELVGTIDFCFSSPPFFDKEIYCDEPSQAYYGKSIQEFINDWWFKTYNNVYKLLKPNSLFVLNMNRDIADKMICVCKDKFELIDTKYVIYKRGHLGKDTTDNFYVLRNKQYEVM